MPDGFAELTAEALATGTLAGLPDRHVIDGRAKPTASGRSLDVFDPGTGQVFAQVAAGDAADIDVAVGAARQALKGPWGRLAPAERGRILSRTAALIRAEA